MVDVMANITTQILIKARLANMRGSTIGGVLKFGRALELLILDCTSLSTKYNINFAVTGVSDGICQKFVM